MTPHLGPNALKIVDHLKEKQELVMSTEAVPAPPDNTITPINSVDSKPVVIPDNTTEQEKTVDVKTEESNNLSTLDKGIDSNIEETYYMSTQEKGATFLSSVINMMNTIIGAGTISLPNTMMISGIAGGGILLVISLLLSLIGAHFLSAASIYTKEDSYGFIGRKVVNPVVGYVADFFMILFDFGISCLLYTSDAADD